MEEEKQAREAEQLSRRGFLASAGKLVVGAAAGAAGLSALASAQGAGQAEAAEAPEWPWPYPGLNPEAVQKRGEELYWKYGCGQGSFEALITELGHPYTTIPTGMLRFGGGGVAGWGSHCGALLGSTVAIQLVHKDPAVANKLITELTGWYTEFQGSGSPLCHVSVTEWSKKNGVRTDSEERKQRCSKLTGATARKAAELLNAQANTAFQPLFGPRATVVGCHSCHGKSGMSSVEAGVLQDCAPCHGDPHKDGGRRS
ncbi:MAG: C-GCAxxG-C-C family (seleno)protein [Chloroflexota bacterium]